MAATASSPRTARSILTIRRSRKPRSRRSHPLPRPTRTATFRPGALSWNDADDNNAFHSKLFVMDFDGTISTEVAIKDPAERDQVTTMGLPLGNDGKPIPAQLGVAAAVIPKGAKNIDVAKDFMKYVIQPQVTNNYLKEGLGRFLPAVPSLVKSDPFWLGNPQRQGLHHRRVVDRDRAQLPGIQPGLGGGQRPTDLGLRPRQTSSATASTPRRPPKPPSERSRRSLQNTRLFRAEGHPWHRRLTSGAPQQGIRSLWRDRRIGRQG